ncbi:MAG: SulP family inorganic anion transporter [Chitinophagaceae bacterium]|nr:SulP family inorganic anion transporter [Chitinophagaceae bacterium]
MKKILKHAGTDLRASLVVFLVALPLCLGIALGSGAPLFAGIIAGIVGGIIVGSLSGSQLSVSGPAAGLTAIVVVAIGKLPSFEAFLVCVVISGLFQVLLGVIKAGVIADYVPSAVIKGMLSAIGIILILKQLPHFAGYDASYEGDETFIQLNSENTFSSIVKSFNKFSGIALIIGSISLFTQLLWDKVLIKKHKLFTLVPAPLVVVAVSIFLNQLLTGNISFRTLTGKQMVSIPVAGTANEFISFFKIPDFSVIANPVIWTTAITLAIVASLETLLNIEAADDLDQYKRVTPTNRELKAQGIGNIISGLIGGLPLTSVVVRTSANINAGARTKMAAIMHGVLLLLAVVFLPAVLNRVPLSALAAVLVYTGYKLAKPSLFKEFWKKGFDQFMPFIITIIAIIFTDLLIGIIIGIVAGLFFVLRSNFKTSVFVVNDGNKYLFRLRKDVSFLNKPVLKNKLESVPENASIIIDATRADFIDKDIIEIINDFLEHAHLKNIKVEIKKSGYKPIHQLISGQYLAMTN